MENEWVISKQVQDASTIGELKFIFSQARDRVKETADEGDRLYNKSIGIISICLTVIIALMGYLSSSKSLSFFNTLGSIIIILILVVVAVRLKGNVLPTGYKGIGSVPQELLKDDFYNDLQGKSTMWYLLINEIRAYKKRIEINIENNDIRNERIKEAFLLLFSIPVLLTFEFLVVVILLDNIF